jgi:transcriptional regulator with XRE-family HTH domain
VSECQPRRRSGQWLSERELAGLQHLGAVLRDARVGRGWSQRDLERRSGVDQTTISRLENGRLVHCRIVRLARLIEALQGRFDIRDVD